MRQIALTLPELQNPSSAEELERLKKRKMHQLVKESWALQELNHIDHVLKYVDREWTPQNLNIITEYAAGGDLERRFKNLPLGPDGKQLCYSEDRLIPMFRILCKTMAKVHAEGWIHRDLKPSNILFRDNSYEKLVIGDFGFASMFKEGRSDLTTEDVGSPRFKAPEQIRGEAHSYPVDMWGLGVTCYYLLKRRHPIHDLDFEREENITPEEVARIDWENLSSNARDFMEKLIVWDPKQRMSALEASNHPWLL
ncbi:hypothetical protein EMPS_05625 [Entomortierella parvispora]|uniref:Protein kinase domain-containing protein n=1 Tax=Entomortierella parvispora TaxID=205924 RepID=A0A9P3LWP1_9FUNG|nr:hypothetical protein EMPS_05625 [Entomortierella parvispora]